MKHMTFANLLDNYRTRKNMTRRGLALRVGITPTYIGQLLKSQVVPPPLETCQKIAKALGLSDVEKQEFFEAAYEERDKTKQVDFRQALNIEAKVLPPNVVISETKIKEIPVISYVTATHWKDICDAHPPGVADEWIPFEAKKAGKCGFALYVDGDCMEPRFRHGQIIIVNPEIKPTPGEFGVFRVNHDEKATFKQFKIVGQIPVLHPLNPKFDDIILNDGREYEVLGKVVGLYEKL
jgi:SOS-response transcriptional repressor LexA